jgi:hypothetical protein
MMEFHLYIGHRSGTYRDDNEVLRQNLRPCETEKDVFHRPLPPGPPRRRSGQISRTR